MNPFDFFDKIFYINLEERTDRKDHIEKLFSKFGIKAERFPAITLSPEQNESIKQDGCFFRNDERPEHARFTKSCALSHINVVLRAKLMQYKNVLIFEDDVTLHDDIIEELSKTIEDLKIRERWDMFYIGCNPLIYQKVTDNLGRSLGALSAHAYAVNNHFYDKILKIPFKHIPVIDICYHDLALDHQNNLYMCNKNLAWQIPGYSTLEETQVDYYPSVQARYDNNMIL
jgi:GR25 family glycosyltransferase involved in LPS biosynthesis